MWGARAEAGTDLKRADARTNQATASNPLPWLTSLKTVRDLSPTEASRGYPVRVRGVVTYIDHSENDLFIQDASAGLWVDGLRRETDLQPGQMVEVEGVSGPGFAPIITRPTFRVLGQAPFPDPTLCTLAEIQTGQQDSQWVEFRGVVQWVTNQAAHLRVSIGTAHGSLVAVIPARPDQPVPTTLVDASVVVHGVCGGLFNAAGQLIGVRMLVPDLAHVRVDIPPPADPFSAPVQTLADILRFRIQGPGQHRIHVRGVVTLDLPHRGLFIEDAGGGIFARTLQQESFQPGDLVDVVGFPAGGGYTPRLEHALARKIGSGARPQAIEVVLQRAWSDDPESLMVPAVAEHHSSSSGAGLAPGSPGPVLDARLVRLKARLLHCFNAPTERVLLLHTQETTFSARWATEDQTAGFSALREGSLVEVTGVCSVQVDEAGIPSSFWLQLRSASDVVVLARPPWWTARHTLWAVAGLATLLLGALAWVNSLRSQVRTRTRQLRREVTEHQQAREELKQAQQEMLEASRLAGKAEVATSVLHNVGNVLNSVNVSTGLLADRIMRSKAPTLAKAVALIREHQADLGSFLTCDPKGSQLPGYLAQLAGHLAQEQDAALEELRTLERNVGHIKEIVAMQQNYARVSGVRERVQVTALVEDALRMHSDALDRHHVQLVREYAPDLPELLLDRHKALQILINLISNAKYACDAAGRTDGRLTARVTRGDRVVKLTILDNGVGVPPENLTHIFNHGFTTRRNGHGFGLHCSALAARELGGSLSAQSEGPGKGAAFTLELPLNSNDHKSPDAGLVHRMAPAADGRVSEGSLG